jgi:hypothetical protein
MASRTVHSSRSQIPSPGSAEEFTTMGVEAPATPVFIIGMTAAMTIGTIKRPQRRIWIPFPEGYQDPSKGH